jgi:glycerophosphoryl diester phosphodiesterase
VQPNPWLERRIVAYAHQGGSFEGPSSTLLAIEHALEVGASAIELDVHATADRQLVVCHDATVDRTTDASGQIAQLTLEQLRQLDNAYWFVEGSDVDHDQPDGAYSLRGRAPRDRRLGIATLAEVLEAFPGVPVNLDIKRTAPEVEPYEALLAEVLREHERRDDVIVASFSDAAMRAFRVLSPTTATSAATAEVVQFVQVLHAGGEPVAPPVVAFQVPESSSGVTVVDEAFVEAAHRAGIVVHVWTVNEPEAMERLLSIGVDGLISDRPSVLAPLLGDKAWRPAGGSPTVGS